MSDYLSAQLVNVKYLINEKMYSEARVLLDHVISESFIEQKKFKKKAIKVGASIGTIIGTFFIPTLFPLFTTGGIFIGSKIKRNSHKVRSLAYHYIEEINNVTSNDDRENLQ